MVYPLVILVTFLALLYFYFTRNFNHWKNKNVVGPKPLPFFGNIKDSVVRRKPMALVLQRIYDAFPDEKVVGIYRMTTPCLLLRDLDVIKQVMIKDFDLFAGRGVEFSKEGLGANLFHADGDTWRVLRNRFTPLFTSGKLRNMLYLMTQRGDIFLEHVKGLCEKQPEQPIHLLLQKFTMATISACAFGVDLDENMFQTLEKVDRLIFTANYSQELDMMYPGILNYFNGSIFPKFVSTFFNNLAQTVIKERGGLPTNRKDFMDLILELRQMKEVAGTRKHENDEIKSVELTDSVIAAQSFVFYAAGYETSATTMTYIFYEVAKNHDVQDKLVAEIDEVLERHNGEISYDCLNEMTYMIQVIDETLRLYPIVDPILRNAQMDCKVPGTNVIIKKGTTVLINTRAIQRDPKYYPNPDKFDPERFSPGIEKSRHPCAYLPFGIGPRNCIGLRFAKVQIQVCMVKLLSKFRFEPSKNTLMELNYDPMRLVITPTGGITLNITHR